MREMVIALLWAVRARIAARRLVLRSGFRDICLPRAPRVGLRWTGLVQRVLTLSSSTCLVSAAVLQEWYAAHGSRFDLVIGVTSPARGFRAHAWLDRPGQPAGEFEELTRIPARLAELPVP